jgi:uncharacterized protein YdeI (YjbR/CyaY-like superfamily)
MGRKDLRVDAYIDTAQPFAKPILKFLRKTVHAGCPTVEETIKWQFPHFDYRGIMCAMAAFKEHCAFGFWKGELIVSARAEKGMGQFGRITSLQDLPDEKTLLGYVRKAAELNERGVAKPGRSGGRPRPVLEVPPYLSAALRKNVKARTTFEKFSPTNRRDYIEWLIEAKREETREQRLKTAIQWMEEGKPRNWKYVARARS